MYALDVRIRDIHTNVTLESNELKKMKSQQFRVKKNVLTKILIKEEEEI